MLYKKPYTRITPYLVGILLGYIFSRDLKFQHKHKVSVNYKQSNSSSNIVPQTRTEEIINKTWRLMLIFCCSFSPFI